MFQSWQVVVRSRNLSGGETRVAWRNFGRASFSGKSRRAPAPWRQADSDSSLVPVGARPFLITTDSLLGPCAPRSIRLWYTFYLSWTRSYRLPTFFSCEMTRFGQSVPSLPIASPREHNRV